MKSQQSHDDPRPRRPPGARRAAKAQTRERVREAARRLFLTRGFDDTTTQQVADLAGVATGTIFQHASDKEDLLMLVLQAPVAAAIREALARERPSDPLTDLATVFATLLRVYVDLMPGAGLAAARAQWFGAGANAKAVQWQYEAFLEQVAARIEAAQDGGALAGGADARALAANLSSLYQGVLLEWLWLDDGIDAAVTRLRAAFALQLIPLQVSPDRSRHEDRGATG